MSHDTKSKRTKYWPPEVLTLEEQDSLRQEMRDSVDVMDRILAERGLPRPAKATAKGDS